MRRIQFTKEEKRVDLLEVEFVQHKVFEEHNPFTFCASKKIPRVRLRHDDF